MPRLFVAVDVPPERCAELHALAGSITDARWMDPTQYHLTLRFLGTVAPDRVDPIATALAGVRWPRFSIGLSGVGTFPEPRGRQPPAVLWAGVAPVEGLRGLKAAVDAVLGPDPDAARSFSPHLTLARFRDRPGPILSQFLRTHASLASPSWEVDAFSLYDSQLGADGAIHRRLRTYPL